MGCQIVGIVNPMPDVPQVPGVPSLSSYGPGGGALLAADAADLASIGVSAVLPQWGIFLNGAPVIQPASFISQALSTVAPVVAPVLAAFGLSFPVFASFIDYEYKQDWPISDYPVEDGGFQSYDKVQQPFELRVRITCAGSAVERQQSLAAIDAVANSLQLFTVMTPEGGYDSCCPSHYDYKRTNDNGGVSMITVDLWFTEIRVTATATFQNTSTPTAAGTQSIGNVQAFSPSASINQMYAAGGFT
jgi:hypothetical protein